MCFSELLIGEWVKVSHQSMSDSNTWVPHSKILIQRGSELMKSASLDVRVQLTHNFTGQSLLPNRNLLL